jgi:hypothetical protein
MKLPSSYQFLGIVIVATIVLSLLVSTTSVLPYSAASLFPKSYPYEGFAGLGYSSSTSGKPMDTYTSFLLSNPNFECKKVHGFDGLYCRPYVADSKLDIYSESDGSLTCSGSGLSNSKGSLCLNKVQSSMLATRGGNATGRPAEIGH